MFPIRLEWQRAADGVDLVHNEEFAKKHMGGDGRAIEGSIRADNPRHL